MATNNSRYAAPYEHFPSVGMRDPDLAPNSELNRREVLVAKVLDSDFFQHTVADNRFMAVRTAGLAAALIGIVIANPNTLKEWNS